MIHWKHLTRSGLRFSVAVSASAQMCLTVLLFFLMGAKPSDGTAQYVMLAGLVLVVMSLMLFTHRRVRRAQKQPVVPARVRYQQGNGRERIGSGIDEAISQLDQLARQVHGQLDIRFAKLEAVIRDADQRIERLSKLSNRTAPESTVDVTLGAESPLRVSGPEPSDTNPPTDHAHADVWRLADAGMTSFDIAKELGKLPGEVDLILSLRRARETAHIVSS